VLRAPKNATFNLQDGDVILSIDGREPTSGSHATRILASYQAGEKVKLEVMRQKKKMTVEAIVPERHMKVSNPGGRGQRRRLIAQARSGLSDSQQLEELRHARIALGAPRAQTPPRSPDRTVLL